MSRTQIKSLLLKILAFVGIFGLEAIAYAAPSGAGLGTVAYQVTSQLGNVAKLITAGSYVAGFGFAVAAIVKFKAHKDNPTQVHLSMGVVLLFVAAGLMFLPSVFKATGYTLFQSGGAQATISGVKSF